MWGDEKALWLATGVRSVTPDSDSGEETLQPLGRSDLVTCGYRDCLQAAGARSDRANYASKCCAPFTLQWPGLSSGKGTSVCWPTTENAQFITTHQINNAANTGT